MLTLVDARQGAKITGIGQYTVHLLEAMAKLSPEQVRPICWRQQRARFTGMGLTPWSPWRGRLYHPRLLPKADVIHGPDFTAPPHRRAARVATIHDLSYVRFPECFPPGFPEALDERVRQSLANTSIFLCDSMATRDEVAEHYGVADDRLRVAHLGVSDAFARTPKQDDVAETLEQYGLQRPFLLHVGALVPRKDIGTLLESYAAVCARVPGMDLVLAGPSATDWMSHLSRLDEWRQRHPDLAQAVRTIGYVDDKAMPRLLHAAQACVSTSLWEGFGLTVLQSLAAGCPAVAARVGAVPEFGGAAVHYGVPGDPESFAVAIEAAVSDTPARRAKVAAGRGIAQRLPWSSAAEKTFAAYCDAAG